MANLATMIMEGTLPTKKNDSIDISGYDFSKQITMETESINNAIVVLYSDILETEQHYMVSDVIVGASAARAVATNESFNAEVVTEGIIKDFFTKIVDALKKFWAKIVEWFKKVFEWFRMMFSNAKEFAKRYGKELRNKKYEGFKHEGFEWTLTKGSSLCDKWVSNFESKLQNLCGKLTFEEVSMTVEYNHGADNDTDEFDAPDDSAVDAVVKRQLTSFEYGRYEKLRKRGYPRDTAINMAKKKSFESILFEADYSGISYKNILTKSLVNGKWEDGESVSDITDKVIKEVTKADDLSDMRSSLEDEFRNGDSEKSTVVEFGSGEYSSPSKIIDFLEKSEKLISDIEKNRKSIEKPITQLIKQIDKMKVDTSDNRAKAAESIITSNISFASSLATGILNCIKTCIDVKVTAYREASKELLTAMKKFYSFKSKK